ncbi:hypothetical protein AWB71_06004 [Caballeronia peredens]|nr:hypothetical protein AWB71_06004 [Caballeronia peredens]
MRNILRNTLLLFVLAHTAAYAEDSKCVAVFKDRLMNTHIGSYELATRAYEFNRRCETNGSVNSANASTEGSFIVNLVPVQEKDAFSYSNQTVKDFCQASAKDNSLQTRYDHFDQEVVVDAFKYVNQCIALENDGLDLNYTYLKPPLITITGHMRNGYGHPDLDRLFYNEDAATCTSTSFSRFGFVKTIRPNSAKLPLPSDFSIQCVRKAQGKGEDSTYYPAVQISASISKAGSNGNKPYEISLPSDASYGPQLQSQANETIQKLKSEKTALETQVSNLQQSLKNQTVVDVKYFYMGENSQDQAGGNHYGGLGKGSTDKDWDDQADLHAKAECGKNKVGKVWHLPWDSEGNCCGYKKYVVTCVAPDTSTSASK